MFFGAGHVETRLVLLFDGRRYSRRSPLYGGRRYALEADIRPATAYNTLLKQTAHSSTADSTLDDSERPALQLQTARSSTVDGNLFGCRRETIGINCVAVGTGSLHANVVDLPAGVLMR